MTTWFITRHAGAREWALRQGFVIDRMIEHLELEQVSPGEVVLGTLPINVVADLNAKGVNYFHLILPLTREQREQEITADVMEQLGARLEQYVVKRV